MTLSKTEIKLVEKLNKRYLKTVNQPEKIKKYRRRTDKLKQNSYLTKAFLFISMVLLVGSMFYFYDLTNLYIESKITEEIFFQKFTYLKYIGIGYSVYLFSYIILLVKKELYIEKYIKELERENRLDVLRDVRENSKLCFQVLSYLENENKRYVLNNKFKEVILILRNDEIKKEKERMKIKKEKELLNEKMQEVMEAESELAYDKLLMYSEIENT